MPHHFNFYIHIFIPSLHYLLVFTPFIPSLPSCLITCLYPSFLPCLLPFLPPSFTLSPNIQIFYFSSILHPFFPSPHYFNFSLLISLLLDSPPHSSPPYHHHIPSCLVPFPPLTPYPHPLPPLPPPITLLPCRAFPLSRYAFLSRPPIHLFLWC